MLGRSNLVVCPEPLAAKAGQGIFARGGNAIDAALAAAFAQGVVDPLLCGLGGMGLIYCYTARDGQRTVLDCGVTIGSRPAPESWPAEYVGRAETIGRYLLHSEANQMGYASIMVPGFVRGCGEAFRRFGSGRLSWADLLAPAIALAREGFEVDAHLGALWRDVAGSPGFPGLLEKLATSPDARRSYLKLGGAVYRVGDRLIQPELAETLERLAVAGPDDFYTGQIGDRITQDLGQHDGLVTSRDLGTYAVREALPCRGSYRGFEITAAPAPASGAHVIQMLQILEHFDLGALRHNSPEYIDLFARVQRASFADNVNLKCREPESAGPIEAMILGTQRAADWARRIRADDRIVVRGGAVDPGTTHVTCVDAEQNVVTFTHSIGSLAGSGVISPGLGFLYNNFLGHYNPLPGHYDSIVAGKRFNGGAPLIVFDAGRPSIAIGAPGGSRIVTAIAQCLVNVLDYGMDMETAVSAARFHTEEGQILFLEPIFPDDAAHALRAMGNDVRHSSYMSRVQAVRIKPISGELEAGSDPRGGVGVGYWPSPQVAMARLDPSSA